MVVLAAEGSRILALNAYLTLRGKDQGDIDGPVTDAGLENTILIHSYSNGIVSPRDPVSGLATGLQQHQPIVLSKGIDQTSPLLWTAFVNNENLVVWQLNFWTSAIADVPAQQIYTIKLTNASIASIQEVMLDNTNLALTGPALQQQISFTYQRIEWIWTNGGVTAESDWGTP